MPAPYRFDVTIQNAEIVFTNAVTAVREYAINLYTVVDVTAQVKQVRVYGLANGDSPWLPAVSSPWSSVANNATMLQDPWPEPTIANERNTQIAENTAGYQQWFVRIHLNDQRFMDIPMGKVVNQDWPNDEVGASECIRAILAEIAMP